jgi:hypothetical protein
LNPILVAQSLMDRPHFAKLHLPVCGVDIDLARLIKFCLPEIMFVNANVK